MSTASRSSSDRSLVEGIASADACACFRTPRQLRIADTDEGLVRGLGDHESICMVEVPAEHHAAQMQGQTETAM